MDKKGYCTYKDIFKNDRKMIRSKKKYLTGTVVSTKMDKTIVVKIERYFKHKKYKKRIKKTKKFYVHDEKNEAKENDVVNFILTKPISKLKFSKLVNIIKKKV